MLAGLAGCRPEPEPRANLILISIDCLNQRQFAEATQGGYAPEMARLDAESVVFTRAYAHAPWTTPSHVSMLTGLAPRQHGLDVPWGLMIATHRFSDRVPAYPALPTLLSAAGYETVAFVGQGSISAIHSPVAGIICVRPTAPAHEATWSSNTLSCRIRANISSG